MLSASEVIKQFGPPLSPSDIAEANKMPSKNQGVREHQYRQFNFLVTDRVFKPSKTGQIIHDMLYDADLTDKTVIIMGTGCGVEGVLCAYRQADKFFACDIHDDSVACARENFHRNIDQAHNKTQAHFVTSNLFDAIPDGEKADIICFDPPAVKVKFSDDPDVVRCSCSGARILEDFFGQIADRRLLNENGTVSIVISNTSDQERIVQTAYDKGFYVKATQDYHWPAPYESVKTFRLDFGIAETVATKGEMGSSRQGQVSEDKTVLYSHYV